MFRDSDESFKYVAFLQIRPFIFTCLNAGTQDLNPVKLITWSGIKFVSVGPLLCMSWFYSSLSEDKDMSHNVLVWPKNVFLQGPQVKGVGDLQNAVAYSHCWATVKYCWSLKWWMFSEPHRSIFHVTGWEVTESANLVRGYNTPLPLQCNPLCSLEVILYF